jgi:hypothetical protein
VRLAGSSRRAQTCTYIQDDGRKKKETSCFVNVKPKSGFCRGMWYRL